MTPKTLTPFFLALVLTSATLKAHPGPSPIGQLRPPPLRMQLARMAWELDLSQAQKEEMRALLKEQAATRRNLRREIHAIRQAIREQLRNGQPDDRSLNERLDQLAGLHRQRLELRIRLRLKILAVLTEEQRQQWLARLAARQRVHS